MGQSNFIVGAILVVFVVYITLKGELPAYMAVFGIGGSTPVGGGTTSINPSGAATIAGIPLPSGLVPTGPGP